MFKLLTIFVLLLLTTPALAADSNQSTDRIIVVVNDRIILKSDVDQELLDYMQQMRMNNQQIEFDEELWYTVLESMIDNIVMLEKAKIDSVVVTDDQVNQQMDLRIQQMVQQAGSEEAVEQALGQTIVEIQADFREIFREQLITQRLRQNQISKVNITRPEVREFFEAIPADSLPMIPEQVALSQIVAIPPPLQDAQIAALEKAQQVRDSIVVHGRSFEEMAERHSTGPASLNGGLLPMMPIDDFVPEYSAAAAALEPGEVSGVVRTSFGYHIIRLNRRVGDSIETNNLLITADEAGIDEAAAISKLEALRDSVLNHDRQFSQLARIHSEDEYTQSMGGRLFNEQTGDRLLEINNLEASLYRTVLLLDEEGNISEPVQFTAQGPRGNNQRAYRIIRLDRHVPEHIANLDQDYDRIRQIALQQKQMREFTAWVETLRDEVYIEYRIDVPEQYREPQPQMHELETTVNSQ